MGVAQTTRRRRFAGNSSPCFIGSFLIHDVVRRDCHSGIAPRGFVSMRDRRHRIARPRLATIMTYRSACGYRSNRAQSSLKKDRLPKARSVRTEPWSRALGSGALASTAANPPSPCGAGSRSKMALALCLSTKFSEDRRRPAFRMTASSEANATIRGPPHARTGTWNFSLPARIHIIYCVYGRHVQGDANCRRRVWDGDHLRRALWMRAFSERVQNRFVRRANNLPLAARRSLGHIGLMETWPSG